MCHFLILHFTFTAAPSQTGGVGLAPRANVTRLKKGGMEGGGVTLWSSRTGLKSNPERKETNSINSSGTLMAQICSSRFGNFSLVFFLFVFFKPNYHGNSAKGGREGGGHGRSIER